MAPEAVRLQLIAGYIRSFKGGSSVREVLDQAAQTLLSATDLERAVIFLINRQDAEVSLKLLTSLPATSTAKDLDVSRTVLSQAMQGSREPVLVEPNENQDTSISQQNLNLASIVALPIYSNAQLHSIIYADRRFSVKKLPWHTQVTLRMLSQVAEHALDRLLFLHQMSVCIKDQREALSGVAEQMEICQENLSNIHGHMTQSELELPEYAGHVHQVNLSTSQIQTFLQDSSAH